MKKICSIIHNNLVFLKHDNAYEEARRRTLNGETWSSHDCAIVFNKRKMAKSKNNLKRRLGIDSKFAICTSKHFVNEKQLYWPSMKRDENGELYEDDEILFFMFKEYRDYFINAKVILCDATFRICLKTSYYQLCTISTKISQHGFEMYVPLCSMLMPDKKKKSYEKGFRFISQRLLGGATLTNLQYFISDWEQNISRAFKSEFNVTQEYQERKCHLHWLRNVEKRGREENIWSELVYKTGIFYRFYSELKYVSDKIRVDSFYCYYRVF